MAAKKIKQISNYDERSNGSSLSNSNKEIAKEKEYKFIQSPKLRL